MNRSSGWLICGAIIGLLGAPASTQAAERRTDVVVRKIGRITVKTWMEGQTHVELVDNRFGRNNAGHVLQVLQTTRTAPDGTRTRKIIRNERGRFNKVLATNGGDWFKLPD
jgi:hypothetical protein